MPAGPGRVLVLTGALALAAGALVAGAMGAGAGDAERQGTTPPQGIRDHTATYVAFTHATVAVSPDKVIENATLVVRGGRVEAVGAGLAVPPGAIETDLEGKRVYPGFVDLVSEYGVAKPKDEDAPGRRQGPGRRQRTPQYEGQRVGANAWNDAIHAETDWVEAFKPDRKAAEALLDRGFTTVQAARMDGIFRGRGFVTSLGEGTPNEVLIEPYGAHFASFDPGSSQQEYPGSLMGSIALVRQTILDAQWYGKAASALRANPDQPAPELDRALAALAANQRPVIFDTAEELSLLRAARIAKEMGVPFLYLGSNFEHQRAAEVAALGAPLVLPLSFPKAPPVQSYEDGLDVSLADLRHWERAPSTAALLDAKGVRFAFTSFKLRDGEDFWDNLRKAVRRGLPKEKALAALTTVPADLAGLGREVGSLEPGRRADFFVADRDPFSERAKLLAVYVGGRVAKEMTPVDAVDFRGGWRFPLDGKDYELSLTGESERLRGKVFAGEQTTDVENLHVSPQIASFSANLGTPAAPAQARFTVRSIGGELVGQASLADGRRVSFTPVRLEAARAASGGGGGDRWEQRSEERRKKEAEVDARPLVSRQTAPNAAFGFIERPTRENVLIKNATVWTNEAEGVLEGADVLISAGKIAAVGRGLTAPAGTRVIDGTGKHVSAGIIDEHSHLAISRGVNEGSHAITAEVRIGDVVDPDDVGVYRALAGGVTAAQLLHGSANPIGGQAQVIKMRWGASSEDMKLEGAPPTIKFALGENVKQSNWGTENNRYPQTRMGVESLMKDAFLAAREYGERHRRYQALPAAERQKTVPPRRDLTLETLLDILESKRFVHCHSYVQSEILMLIRLAEELGFKVQNFTHILEGYKVAPEMAAHGTTASSFADWWAYKFEVYDAIPYNTCLMAKAGVVTSINSDSEESIRRLNQEAAKSVMYCDMEPAEALKLATLNPAIQLKIDHRTGSLKAGKDADFVIWNDNPLSIYARAVETWVDGVLMFTLERDAALRQADAAERQALIDKVLASGEEQGRSEWSMRRNEKDWHCDDVEDVWHARYEDR